MYHHVEILYHRRKVDGRPWLVKPLEISQTKINDITHGYEGGGGCQPNVRLKVGGGQAFKTSEILFFNGL